MQRLANDLKTFICVTLLFLTMPANEASSCSIFESKQYPVNLKELSIDMVRAIERSVHSNSPIPGFARIVARFVDSKHADEIAATVERYFDTKSKGTLDETTLGRITTWFGSAENLGQMFTVYANKTFELDMTSFARPAHENPVHQKPEPQPQQNGLANFFQRLGALLNKAASIRIPLPRRTTRILSKVLTSAEDSYNQIVVPFEETISREKARCKIVENA